MIIVLNKIDLLEESKRESHISKVYTPVTACLHVQYYISHFSVFTINLSFYVLQLKAVP